MSSTIVLARHDLAQFPFDAYADLGPVHLLAHPTKAGVQHLPAERRANFSSIQVYDNYDTNARIEHDAARLIEDRGVGRIVALSEIDVLRASTLRSRYGIGGITHAEALAFRDKMEMKDQLRRAGVTVPEAISVETGLDLLDARRSFGMPFVVKPRLGGGSVGTLIINTEADFARLLDNGVRSRFFLPAAMEAEQYVTGNLCHIDGLVVNGQVDMIWPSRYLSSTLSSDPKTPLASMTLAPDDPATGTLISITKNALHALGVLRRGITTYFHCEIFADSGNYTVCEIAARPGGVGVVDCLDGKHATSSFARLVAADRRQTLPPAEPTQQAFGWICVPGACNSERAIRAVAAENMHRVRYYDRGPRQGQPQASSVDVQAVLCLRASDSMQLQQVTEETRHAIAPSIASGTHEAA